MRRWWWRWRWRWWSGGGAAHLARLLHVILERLPRRVVREVADEDGRAAPAVPGAHRPAAALAVAAALALLAAVVLADDNLAAVELGVHQGLDRVRRARLVGELDDAEAGRAAVLPRLHVGAHHLARLLHVVLERLPRRLVREVADVDRDHVCWLLRRDRGAARPQTQVNRARRSFFGEEDRSRRPQKSGQFLLCLETCRCGGGPLVTGATTRSPHREVAVREARA